jgi:hypothetical protein
MQQCVHYGAGVTPCSGMYDYAGGLVHGDQVLIGVEDIEGNLLGECSQRRQLAGVNVNRFDTTQNK